MTTTRLTSSDDDEQATPPRFWTNSETGLRLAYHKVEGTTTNDNDHGDDHARRIVVVFLHGLQSDMEGAKALALQDHCRQRGTAFVRFDCLGHGQSDGSFVKEGTMEQWYHDTLNILDHVVVGSDRVLLVGSSMGVWNGLLTALERPHQVVGLVGLASAPDFTQRVIYDSLTPQQHQELAQKGVVAWPSPYSENGYYNCSQNLLDNGRRHLVLSQRTDDDESDNNKKAEPTTIPLHMPVRLIHGMKDDIVSWQTSLELQQQLESDNVELTLVKDGDHRLSRPQDLQRIVSIVEQLLCEI